VSYVFLTGDRALKLKKAVKFPYLDYSTVEKRRHFCEREVELNRRTAPGLYLGVEPVEIDGAVADWVVVMRRFDNATLFDKLEITPSIARDLADRIAAFHDAAEVTPQYGGAAAMARLVDANKRDQENSGLDRAKIDAVHAAGRSALAAVAELLDARRADGRVRFGHGDLHLRNICLYEGKPTLFDGIEFDDAIACVDVLYDLAFLLMDLEHRGRRDVANRVLNRYLARRDEIAGLAAMPLFLSCRAGIRAHTNKDPSYLDLAAGLIESPPARLIAVGGLSGSGKSTVAEAIAPGIGRAPGAVVLRSDVIRKRLLGADPEARLGPEGYTPEMSRRVYDAVREQAAVALGAGASVIADAVHARPEERDAIEAVARRAGVDFAGLWLEASPEVLASRVRGRENDASDATVEVVREQLSYDTGAIAWRRLDASPDLAVTMDRVRDALARPG
jgi:aminoglycoside phosphotransferase family enzyme/predicted kinase